MRDAHPLRRSIAWDLEDCGSVTHVDADLSDLRLRPADPFEERQGRRCAAGRVDDEVRREGFRLPGVVFIPNGGRGAAIVRGKDLRDTRARANVDVRLLHEASPAEAFE